MRPPHHRAMRVLIVEDDARLGNVLRLGLEDEGIAADLVGDGDAALAAAVGTPFDVITLDIMLPGRDGFSVCTELRASHVRTPVLMLTARDAVEDRVRGLEAGADDYLVKPFAFIEFLARVRALARRHLEGRGAVLSAGAIQLDTAARELVVAGRPIGCARRELAILEYLMHHPRQVLSRRQIEEHVWSYDFESGSNLVDVYVGRLRRRLAEAGAADHIATLRGLGYRFDPVPGPSRCAAGDAEPASG
jgi:DNA-binding response OmpR family regulator